MEFNALKADVARGRIPALLYLYGDNTRAMDLLLEACCSSLFAGEDPPLNRTMFDAQVHSAAEVVQAARTLPFAAPRRLVVVRRADAFKADDWGVLEKYCARPSASCCLVLTAEKPVLKGALLKLFQQHGSPVACANPKRDADVRSAVRQELARHGLSAGDEALGMIAEAAGGDGMKLAGEIEKLALYCRGKKKIDADDAAAVLSAGHASTIFNLVDGIGSGQLEKSLQVLGRLVHDGMHALQIMKMVVRQFRLIAIAREGLRRGLPPGMIARDMGLRDWQAQSIIRQAPGWPDDCLEDVFRELYHAQIALKRSRMANRAILEVLIARLAVLRGQRPA
jgi:DNA polymerase-3 subunit delta